MTNRVVDDAESVAGNGLLDRRYFLKGGAVVAGALTGLGGASEAIAEPLVVPDWMKVPGGQPEPYGQPSKYEAKVVRNPRQTPHQLLDGTVTPAGLHFVVVHNGVPEIDPDQHRLVIHGLVKRPLEFTVNDLLRYPMISRIMFLECAGNSGALVSPSAVDGTAQSLHGLLSCSEWTGVPLSLLLDEAGIDPKADWILAEGADAAAVSRSIPMVKALGDAMIGLYQNGERLRPANGYPMRLLVPGYQGNMNVKWLRRLKVTHGPSQTRFETSRYSILLEDGRVAQFKFPLDAKSIITKPSPGLTMKAPGYYEISGLAWSGNGKIVKAEVSADGGKSWAEAALSGPVLPVALTRFRLPWHWDGRPVILQSRATDDTGYVQPTRAQFVEARGLKAFYHCNAITSWSVAENGEVKHVYA